MSITKDSVVVFIEFKRFERSGRIMPCAFVTADDHAYKVEKREKRRSSNGEDSPTELVYFVESSGGTYPRCVLEDTHLYWAASGIMVLKPDGETEADPSHWIRLPGRFKAPYWLWDGIRRGTKRRS